MKLPTPLLSNWMSAYDFAEPPIHYNLASSTGLVWTFGELQPAAHGRYRSERPIQIEEA